MILVTGSCFRKLTRSKAWLGGDGVCNGTRESRVVDIIKKRVTFAGSSSEQATTVNSCKYILSRSWIPSLRTWSPSKVDIQSAEHIAASFACSSDLLIVAAAAAVEDSRTRAASGRCVLRKASHWPKACSFQLTATFGVALLPVRG